MIFHKKPTEKNRVSVKTWPRNLQLQPQLWKQLVKRSGSVDWEWGGEQELMVKASPGGVVDALKSN